MKTKVFSAKSMSEGLKKISQEFGDNAIILSRSKTPAGVEIVAAIEGLNEHIETAPYRPALISDKSQSGFDNSIPETLVEKLSNSSASGGVIKASPYSRKKNNSDLSSKAGRGSLADLFSALNTDQLSSKERKENKTPKPNDTLSANALETQIGSANVKTQPDKNSNLNQQKDLRKMREEILSLKDMLESQGAQLQKLTEFDNKKFDVADYQVSVKPEPDNFDELEERLERMGLIRSVRRSLLERVDARLPLKDNWKSSLSILSEQINTFSISPSSKGGVYSFIGMTGAGKTTSLGKIATKFVLEHGPEDLLIVTLDSYRIGSADSLKSMCRILGCDFATVSEDKSLGEILRHNAFKKMILIDTCGGLEGVDLYTQEMHKGGNACKKIKPLLVMPCTADFRAMHDHLKQYSGLQPSGCILSKLDESRAPAAPVCLSIIEQLPVAYWTDGQAMATDLHTGNSISLVNTLVMAMNRKQPEIAPDNRRQWQESAFEASVTAH